ncbi:hypothetical protein ONE63_003906 [Megalurothrips usitatus]|uniref:C2H2-type domain-containing protein n=1 Tax=Megalurothrips usitatus TaxID=439358 RepID=A0AAV7XBG0_9NEOP|nr:hypothetical protein ONE63_003906 [Megalurothrips usitatus]
MHSGERPHACATCGARFTSTCHLQTHLQVHAVDGGHECPVCKAGYGKREHLKAHMRTHAGGALLECGDCGRKFLHADKLRRHRLDHAPEAAWPCAFCPRTFREQSGLNGHLRTHPDRLPSACTDCRKRFANDELLREHVWTAHIEKKGRKRVVKRSAAASPPAKRPVLLCVPVPAKSEDSDSDGCVHGCEAAFECPVCHGSMADASALREHVWKEHIAGERLECPPAAVEEEAPSDDESSSGEMVIDMDGEAASGRLEAPGAGGSATEEESPLEESAVQQEPEGASVSAGAAGPETETGEPVMAESAESQGPETEKGEFVKAESAEPVTEKGEPVMAESAESQGPETEKGESVKAESAEPETDRKESVDAVLADAQESVEAPGPGTEERESVNVEFADASEARSDEDESPVDVCETKLELPDAEESGADGDDSPLEESDLLSPKEPESSSQEPLSEPALKSTEEYQPEEGGSSDKLACSNTSPGEEAGKELSPSFKSPCSTREADVEHSRSSVSSSLSDFRVMDEDFESFSRGPEEPSAEIVCSPQKIGSSERGAPEFPQPPSPSANVRESPCYVTDDVRSAPSADEASITGSVDVPAASDAGEPIADVTMTVTDDVKITVTNDTTMTVPDDVGKTEDVYFGETEDADAGKTENADDGKTEDIDIGKTDNADVGKTEDVDVGMTEHVDVRKTQDIDVGNTEDAEGRPEDVYPEGPIADVAMPVTDDTSEAVAGEALTVYEVAPAAESVERPEEVVEVSGGVEDCSIKEEPADCNEPDMGTLAASGSQSSQREENPFGLVKGGYINALSVVESFLKQEESGLVLPADDFLHTLTSPGSLPQQNAEESLFECPNGDFSESMSAVGGLVSKGDFLEEPASTQALAVIESFLKQESECVALEPSECMECKTDPQ